MKAILIPSLLMLASIICYGQNFKDNFQYRNQFYSISTEHKNLETFNIHIERDTLKIDFSLNPLKLEPFIAKLKSKMLPTNLNGDAMKITSDSLTAIGKEMFFKIVADNINITSDAPVAGTLKIKQNIDAYKSIQPHQLEWYKFSEKKNYRKADSTQFYLQGDTITFKVKKDSAICIIKKDTTRYAIKGGSAIIKIRENKYSCSISNDKVWRVNKIESEKLTVKDVEIEFSEGFIETIKIIGEIKINGDKREMLFENKYGIGFSTRRNFKDLSKIVLYDSKSDNNQFIYLNELLDYDYTVRPMTRDFSPANQVISTLGNQSVVLRKEESSKILEAAVFSDFLGFDKDKPNGLIQTEVSKRVNLISYRYQLGNKAIKGVGFFQYVRVAGMLSKIEENNRYLQTVSQDSIIKSSTKTDSLLIPRNYANPLNILQYQNLSLGLDLNLFFLDWPDGKLHFYINGGFRFGRTSIRDSLRSLTTGTQSLVAKTNLVNEYTINHFTFFPEFLLQLLPEERFSILLSYKPQYFSPAFGEPKLQTVNKEFQIGKRPTKWIETFEIMAYVKLGDLAPNSDNNGKLFARWRFNHQKGNIYENYHQLQVGYSFYVLKKN